MKPLRIQDAWARTAPVRMAANDDCFGSSSVEADALPSFTGDDLFVAAVDVMETIEDLWLRLAARCAIRVQGDAVDRVTVCIACSEHGHGDRLEVLELMRVATSATTYRWKEGGRSGSLAEAVAWDGQTGVVHLAPWSVILSWTEGESMAWALQTLVARLRSWSMRSGSLT